LLVCWNLEVEPMVSVAVQPPEAAETAGGAEPSTGNVDAGRTYVVLALQQPAARLANNASGPVI